MSAPPDPTPPQKHSLPRDIADVKVRLRFIAVHIAQRQRRPGAQSEASQSFAFGLRALERRATARAVRSGVRLEQSLLHEARPGAGRLQSGVFRRGAESWHPGQRVKQVPGGTQQHIEPIGRARKVELLPGSGDAIGVHDGKDLQSARLQPA